MKIVAIGSGEIGRIKILPDGTAKQMPDQLLEIDRIIVRMAGKPNPRLLLVSTASRDPELYFAAVENHFGKKLGCICSWLKMAIETPTESEMRAALDNADIVYVGGGNTVFMMERWKEVGFDKLLIEYKDKLVLSGISAGAVCWFDWYDNIDVIDDDYSKLKLLPGFDFVHGMMAPHWDEFSIVKREAYFELQKKHEIKMYCVDRCAAVVIDGDNMEFVSAADGYGIETIQ